MSRGLPWIVIGKISEGSIIYKFRQIVCHVVCPVYVIGNISVFLLFANLGKSYVT
jgi:hypothetical protein